MIVEGGGPVTGLGSPQESTTKALVMRAKEVIARETDMMKSPLGELAQSLSCVA